MGNVYVCTERWDRKYNYKLPIVWLLLALRLHVIYVLS